MEELLSQQSFTFWFVISSYCALLAGISIYFVKYVKNTDDFFGASKHTPWWISGLSYIMTAFSASVFVVNASLAYRYGTINICLILAQIPCFIFGYYLFSRKWHRTRAKTAIEFIETRYSRNTAKFFVWTGIPIRILDNANRLYVTAVLIEVLFGVGLWTALIFTSIVTLVYTVAGGFLAVVVTDALQAIVLGIVVLVVGVIAFFKVGGLEGFLSRVPEGYWSFNPPDSDIGVSFTLVWAIAGLVAWQAMWSLVQRYVSVETESDARKVALTSGISYYILFPLLALPPMFAAVLLPNLEGASGAEQCYIRLAEMILPAGLLGLLCFAIFGATVTALNSELNVMSQVLVQDVLKKVVAKWSDKAKLLLSRLIIIIIMAGCLSIALAIRSLGGAFKYVITVGGMTVLPMFVPMLMGLLYKKTPGWGSMAAFGVGMITSIVFKFVIGAALPWVILSNGITTLATMLITGTFWPISGEKKEIVDQLFTRLDTPNSGNPEVSEGPVRTKGIMLPLIAVSMLVLAFIVLITAMPIMGEETVSVAGIVTSVMFAVAGGILFLIRWKLALNFSK